ncbi:MAG: serine acetyltransferase [Sphaerochaeta sp.]|nr:serine acetyltransferase [Sphaerochaeta sp.]
MKDCKDQSFDATAFLPNFLGTFERVKGNANFYGMKQLPQMLEIGEIANEYIELMFPGRCGRDRVGLSLQEILQDQLNMVSTRLMNQVLIALKYSHPQEEEAVLKEKSEHKIKSLCAMLPEIRLKLKLDAKAGFEGDPAARNVREVILSYPFMKTLVIHRIAHELFKMQVPLIPRMFNEYAHKETGIDIHPGAVIGASFFIDHGTGVVIGETSIIGDNVKIYQGVTLGALSFPKDACGELIRGARRHPTIEDNVTIYSNATILGDITIGKNAVIGSNVWIKEDVPAHTMAIIQEPKLTFRDLHGRKN